MTVGAPAPPKRGPAGPAAAPPATAPSAAAGSAPPHRSGRVRAWLSGTPGRLRILTAVVVVVTVGFGLLAMQAFRATSAALDRADHNTAQLLRVQSIAIDLVKADATATNSFLVGGLEPPEQRAAYQAAMDDATALVARAATAQPADADALAALNTIVAQYSGTVEQARANNRQNLQIGAQYLRNASAALRSQALPILDALAAANSDRVDTELNAAEQSARILDLLGVLAVIVLAGVLVWLAMMSRRRVNVGVAVSLVVVLATLIISAIVLNGVGKDVQQVRDGPLARTTALGAARVAAFDARSNESLTLIARGSGQSFEKAWLAASAKVTTVDPDLADEWAPYVAAHQQLRKLDDGGKWEAAVNAATAPAMASSTSFGAFAKASASALAAQQKLTSDGLRSSNGWLPWVAWLALIAGALAAFAGWRGVGQRLEEYR